MDWEKYASKKIKPAATGGGGDPFSQFFENPMALVIIVVIFFVSIGAFSSFYRVHTQERAVVTRLGKYLKTSEPGLHFKIPFGVDRVFKEETTVIQEETFGFLSSEGSDSKRNPFYASTSYGYKQRNTEAESSMLTGDLNVADVKWVVQFRISDLQLYLFNVRDPRKNIRDVSEAVMRRVVGDMSVQDVITQGRVSIEDRAKVLTQEILDHYGIGVEIVELKLQDVNPPEKVKPAFNEVNSAKQEQEQAINMAEAERNRIIPETRGKAEQAISNAQGYALEVVNQAKGDAVKFEQILTEYKKAPEITRIRLYLDLMRDLLKRTEGVTVVDPSVKGVLPIYTGTTEPIVARK